MSRSPPAEKARPAPKFLFAARDRMDETYDRVRSVRGERYRYVRNFRPELPYFQYINYMDEMPIMKDWRRLAFEGKLNDTQKLFWSRTKPKEELYDMEKDPFEVKLTREIISVKSVKTRMEGDYGYLRIASFSERTGEETVDGVKAPRTDAYRMLAHDERGQKYIALPSGFAYTPRRVDDGYQLPPCDLIS